MKKLLSTLLVLSLAGSAMATTYTEQAVNKLVSPVAKKEAAATSKATQAQKDYQAKKRSCSKSTKTKTRSINKTTRSTKEKT